MALRWDANCSSMPINVEKNEISGQCNGRIVGKWGTIRVMFETTHPTDRPGSVRIKKISEKGSATPPGIIPRESKKKTHPFIYK